MSLTHGVGEFFALDMGTNSIRLIQLKGNAQKGWVLDKYAYVPIDEKVSLDSSEAGRHKLSEIILGAVAQAGIKTKNVALGLPAGKTYTTIIEVPNASEKELAKTVKYEVDQYVPMAVDDAKIDYAVLGASPKDQSKAEILVSSVAKDYAEAKMELLEELGFNVIAQEPEPLAMTRSLAPLGVNDARLIIDLGEKTTDLVMIHNNVPRLVRSVPGGFSALVKILAGAMSIDETQARQLILKFGLAQDQLEGKIFKVLGGALESFALEITKSIGFFQNKYGNAVMGGIVLADFAGMIPFIAEYIEAKTGVSTVQGNPWQYVKVTPQQQETLLPVASEFAVAIGLAERSND